MPLTTTTLVTPPGQRPVTLTEAKHHLRVDDDSENGRIRNLLDAATSHIQDITGRALIEQTWDWFLDAWPRNGVLEVPSAPLSSVTSITYLDTAGDTQTLDTDVYTVNTDREPGRITLALGQSWPTLRGVPDQITVRFVAGYGTTNDTVPEPLRQGILYWVEATYDCDQRGHPALMQTVDSIVAPFRLWGIAI